ncbi:MAG: HAD family hydrolase [Sphaerochaeta sp.]
MRTDRALIFDFNGTLFWDTEYHRKAWGAISLRLRNRPFTDKESHHLNGRTNAETIAYLLGRTPSEEEVFRISGEKEELYEDICLGNRPLSLAPGAIALFKRAKLAGFQLAIATSAGEDNIRRYEAWFSLSEYVPSSLIIYDNGKRKGKPEPDIYQDTCKALGLNPEACTVFEDTKAGILSASRAGIGSIYAVGSPGADLQTIQAMEGVHGLITNFSEFNLKQ